MTAQSKQATNDSRPRRTENLVGRTYHTSNSPKKGIKTINSSLHEPVKLFLGARDSTDNTKGANRTKEKPRKSSNNDIIPADSAQLQGGATTNQTKKPLKNMNRSQEQNITLKSQAARTNSEREKQKANKSVHVAVDGSSGAEGVLLSSQSSAKNGNHVDLLLQATSNKSSSH